VADADAETRGGVLQRQFTVAKTARACSFKDQRAHQIGDLLTVTVNITDQANFANETQRSRAAKEDSGITDFLGKQLLTGNASKALEAAC